MKNYTKTSLWGIAGLFVSFYYINNPAMKYFAYPLIVLSILMFFLAFRQYKKDN